MLITLRGGGCGVSKVMDDQSQQVTPNIELPNEFQNKIKEHVTKIKSATTTLQDNQATILNSVQFFFLNERLFQTLVEKYEMAKLYVDLLQISVTDLLEAVKVMIKSKPNYAYYCLQIAEWMSKVVFWFYTRNDQRFLTIEEQSNYLTQLSLIEEQVKIERNENIYESALKYEIYVIKAIFTIFPNNSKEGQEILLQMAKGAFESLITMKISDNVTEGLKKGVKFAANEGYKLYLRNQYKKIFQIEKLQWQVMDGILQDNVSVRRQVAQLGEQYKAIQSSSWEIHYCWIQSLGKIICTRPIINKSDIRLQDETIKQLVAYGVIINQNTKQYQINLNIQKINSKQPAQELYHSLLCMSKLSDLQSILIFGNNYIPKFESYSQQLQEGKDATKRVITSTQYFGQLFSTLNLDFYLKRIEELQRDLTRTQSNQKLYSFSECKTQQEVDQQLEFLCLTKEFLNMTLNKMIDLIPFYVQLLFLLEQWNQFINPDTSNPQNFLNDTFMIDLRLSQLQIIEIFSNQLNEDQNYKTVKQQFIEDFELIKVKPFQITEVKTQIEQCQVELEKRAFKSISLQNLAQNQLEYAILFRLKQCQKIFEAHKSNITQIINIRLNLSTINQLIEETPLDEVSGINSLLKPILERIKLLQNTIIITPMEPQLQLLELVKELNSFEMDKQTRSYNPLPKESSKIFQINQYDNLFSNYQVQCYLGAIKVAHQQHETFQLNLKQQNISVIQINICNMKLAIVKLQTHLNDYEKCANKYLDLLRSFQYKTSVAQLGNYSDFQTKVIKQLDAANDQKKQNTLDFVKNAQKLAQEQFLATNSNYQELIQINPYDQQIIQEYERQQAELQNLIKNISLILELEKKKPDKFQSYQYSIINKMLQVTKASSEQANSKTNKQERNSLNSQNNLTETIKNYEDQYNNLKKLIKICLQDIQQAETDIKMIKEVSLACPDVDISVEWLKKVQNSLNDNIKKLYTTKVDQITLAYQQPFRMNSNIAQDIIDIIYPQKQQKQTIISQIDEFINADKQRVKECMAFQLFKISEQCLRQNSKQETDLIVLRMRSFEIDKRLRKILTSPEFQQQMNQVLQKYWPSQQETIVQEIKAGMKVLNSLLYELQQENDNEKKKNIKKEYRSKESQLQEQLQNVQEIGNSLGITMLFIRDLKKDLVKIDQKINEIQDTLNNMNNDLQYLRGKTIYQLFDIRKNQILRNKKILDAKSIYIKIRCVEKKFLAEGADEDKKKGAFSFDQVSYLYNADPGESDGEVNEFLKEDKTSLLVHGPAGSGKSTASRKIEEYLWELYEKTPDKDIKLIPIVIQLPLLQDPKHSAMYEALKSDNYKFDQNQLRELKEQIEQQKIKLLIIMDSYDELHQDHIGTNLIRSNKLSNWGHKQVPSFPKIIITTRTEILSKADYYEWFLPEQSDNFSHYKEIRLERFDRKQRNTYIDQYLNLSVKKVLYDTYYLMTNSQTDLQMFENFLILWNSIKLEYQTTRDETLLSQQQIGMIQDILLSDKSIQIDSVELKRNLIVQLSELKSGEFYKQTISMMNIEHILETPFMMEIVVQVLPTLIKHKSQQENVKPFFIEAFSHLLAKINNENQEYNDIKAHEAWSDLTKDQTFFEDFSITMKEPQIKKKVASVTKDPKIQNIYAQSLLSQRLTQYDFYQSFFDLYFEKQINKLKEQGQAFDYISLTQELWKFAKNLALKLSFQNKTQVEYKAQGLIYKKEQKSWEDEFFDDDCKEGVYKKMFRSCIPMKQQTNSYSFNHKSLQEFLVAKDLLDRFEDITLQLKARQLKDMDIVQQDFEIMKIKEVFSEHFINSKSWSIDFMKGSCSFVIQKVQRSNQIKNLMFRSVELTKDKDSGLLYLGSNCLFLLQKMGESFMDKDITNINIVDIDLTGANFAFCDLSGSIMNNVNISGINVFNTNLKGVKWSNIQVAQLPPKQHVFMIKRLIYLRNGYLLIQNDHEIQLEGEKTDSNRIIYQNEDQPIRRIRVDYIKDQAKLYIFSIKGIEQYEMNKYTKTNTYQSSYNIQKVRIQKNQIFVLLQNSDFFQLEGNDFSQIKKLDVRAKIIDFITEKIDIKIQRFWINRDANEIYVNCPDLYSISLNDGIKTSKPKKLYSITEKDVKFVKFNPKLRILIVDNKIKQIEGTIKDLEKQDIFAIFFHKPQKDFLLFSKTDFDLISSSELKIKNTITHNLDRILRKKLSQNDEMLITIHQNKVAIWNIKQFELIQVLSQQSQSCAMDYGLKILAMGRGNQVLYQDLKSMTSQKQLNFQMVHFASKSQNFLGITQDSEIYFFNVQSEIKYNLILKPSSQFQIYFSPLGEKFAIKLSNENTCRIQDCVRSKSDVRHGFFRQNFQLRENNDIFFIKGQQLFKSDVKDFAQNISPIKAQHDEKLNITYLKVTNYYVFVNQNEQYVRYSLQKNIQQSRSVEEIKNVTKILIYDDYVWYYVVENKRIYNQAYQLIYGNNEKFIDSKVSDQNDRIIVALSQKVVIITLGDDNIRPFIIDLPNILKVEQHDYWLFLVEKKKIRIWDLDIEEEIDSINFEQDIQNIRFVRDNEQEISYLAVVINNKVQLWDYDVENKEVKTKQCIDINLNVNQISEIYYDKQILIVRGQDNIISWYDLTSKKYFKYQPGKDKDAEAFNYSKFQQFQFQIRKNNKIYIYGVKDGLLVRQRINADKPNNLQVVINFKYEYENVILYDIGQTLVAIVNNENQIFVSNDNKNYQKLAIDEQKYFYNLQISNDENYLVTISDSYDGNCQVWSVKDLKLKQTIKFTRVSRAFFLDLSDLILEISIDGVGVFYGYSVEHDIYDKVAAFRSEIMSAGSTYLGFSVANKDSSIDMYGKRKYTHVDQNQHRLSIGLGNMPTTRERYVRTSVFNYSSNQPIQAFDADLTNAFIQSHIQLSLVELFNQKLGQAEVKN
ncbi:hypothetical protein pb186bvf_004566 [Paramecium bursaria]